MDVLSPELVLVDPVLAADARRRLPDPPDCLAAREPTYGHAAAAPANEPLQQQRASRLWITAGTASFPGAGRPAANEARGVVLRAMPSLAPSFRLAPSDAGRLVEERPPRVRPSLLAIVVALLVALAVGLPSFDLVPWSAAERPSFATDVEPRTEPRTEPVLTWPRVKGADFYDVVLWRGSRRILDLWPETNRVDVVDAVAASGKRLDPGRYHWFAFAGFGSGEDVRFGQALANGTFTIPTADGGS
jgi:hypothetical protein